MKISKHFDSGILLKTTKDLIEICNRIYPKLDTDQFSEIEEKTLKENIDLISEITQQNLDLMYPNRKRKVPLPAAKQAVKFKEAQKRMVWGEESCLGIWLK